MNADDWRRVEKLFDAAVALPQPDRETFLVRECASDLALRDTVAAMLRADQCELSVVDSSIPVRLGLAEQVVGRRFGAWTVVALIAFGGMGAVFTVRRADGAYDLEAALKTLGAERSEQSRAQFEFERQLLAKLSHPNIARLLDGGTTDEGVPFLVLEKVDGQHVDRFCDELSQTLVQRLQLFSRICLAVEHAHSRLIVHGDLKPANVLVGQDGEPKLVDFGIAQLIGTASPGHERMDTLGDDRRLQPHTRSSASPEQIRGEPLSTAADVWALGMILARLTDHSGDADVKAIVARACAEGMRARYASVSALREDVQRRLGLRPIEARQSSFGYRFSRYVRRHALAVSLVTTAVGALSVATVISLRAAGAAARDRDAAAASERLMRAERDRASVEAESTKLIEQLLLDTFLLRFELNAEQASALADAAAMTAERARRSFAARPQLLGNVLDAVGELFVRLRSWEAAEDVLQEARLLRQNTYGADSVEVALSDSSLGELAFARGDVVEAHERFTRAYEYYRRLPGEMRGDPAGAANNLAVTLRALGHLDEARAMHEQALAIRLAVAGAQPGLPVAESLNNLAVLDLGMGASARALERLERAVEIRTRCLGEQHPLTLQAIGNMASAHAIAGHEESAADELERVVAGLKTQGSHGQYGLLRALGNLAKIRLDMGEAAMAADVAQRAVELAERLGADRGEYGVRLCSVLATALARSGDPQRAEARWRQACELAATEGIPSELRVEMLASRACFEITRGEPQRAEALVTALSELLRSIDPAPAIGSTVVEALQHAILDGGESTDLSEQQATRRRLLARLTEAYGESHDIVRTVRSAFEPEKLRERTR